MHPQVTGHMVTGVAYNAFLVAQKRWNKCKIEKFPMAAISHKPERRFKSLKS